MVGGVADHTKPAEAPLESLFPDGDPRKLPTVTQRFCSPIKKGPRAKRAQKRRELSVLSDSSPSPSPSSCRSVTPLPTVCTGQGQEKATFKSECSSEPCCSSTLVNGSLLSQSQTQVTVNTVLLARIEFLKSENASLKKKIQSSQNYFNIEQIYNNDDLVRFYTVFFLLIVCFSISWSCSRQSELLGI